MKNKIFFQYQDTYLFIFIIQEKIISGGYLGKTYQNF